MTKYRPPSLPNKYKIAPFNDSLIIDETVKNILSQSRLPPIHPYKESNNSRAMENLPENGMTWDKAVATLLENIGNNYRKLSHPGFMGYIASPGLPTDPAGYSLMSAINHNAIGEQGSSTITFLEKEFIKNIAKIAGLPESAGGVLTGGGTISNLSALITAMHGVLGTQYREKGIETSLKPVVLTSDQSHFSIERACISMGLGSEGLIYVESDDTFRMSVQGLKNKLVEIKKNNKHQAVCVVANAGTTLTGAIDPLVEISEICQEYNLWLHVDAAYGGAALLNESSKKRLAGIELADSITIDLHKWLYQTYSGSILLYRDESIAREVFSFHAEYLPVNRDGLCSAYNYYDLSLEVSRPARILPVMLSFYYYGTEILGHNIKYNIECVEYLAHLVRQHTELELIASPQLSICCFRFIGTVERKVNQVNDYIVDSLRTGGDFYLSPAIVDGKSILRVCICSYNTTAEHIEMLIEHVIRIGCDYSDQLD